jgi:hypothetical protein
VYRQKTMELQWRGWPEVYTLQLIGNT